MTKQSVAGPWHVLVLAGGLSHERDVSLRSGSRLAAALREAGHQVSVRDADGELLDWIAETQPDVAVVALHGGRGEDGSIQAVLDIAGIPYVGTCAAHCRLSWDKATAKALMQRAGFTTPRWVTVSHSDFRDLGAANLVAAMGEHLSFPLSVKPHQGGSALGMSMVTEPAELPPALVDAFAYSPQLLVEEFVRGIEIAISVTGDGDAATALPVVEIAPPYQVYDFEARYTAGATTFHTPARLSDDVAAAARELALGAHHTLGLRDISRTDAIVTDDGRVVFLEVNVSPGLTRTSLLPLAVSAAGRSLGEVYSELIDAALTRTDSVTS